MKKRMQKIGRRFWMLSFIFGLIVCYRKEITAGILQVSEEIIALPQEETKKIALTFDDGPHPLYTPKLLEGLKERQVTATFFVTGENAALYPELIEQMQKDGHIVGNHTYHHYDMSKIADAESFKKEMVSVEDVYREITGQEMTKYYRPPQGKYSVENLKMAKDLGYHTFFWSLAYVDWKQDAQPSHEEAFDKLMSRIHPGAIVLLHSTSVTNAEILDELLTKWEAEGYRFGTLDELIS